MAHSAPCERAKGRSCKCHCLNTMHGQRLLAPFVMAPPSPTETIAVEVRGHPPVTATDADKQILGDAVTAKARPDLLDRAIAAVLDSLLEEFCEEEEVDAVRVLARGISSEVGEQVERHLEGGTAGIAEVVQAKPRHFWCAILTAICRLYDEGFDWAEDAADEAVEKIFELIYTPLGDALTVDSPHAHGTRQRSRSENPVSRAAVPEDRLEEAFQQLRKEAWEPLIKAVVRHIIAAVEKLGEDAAIKYVRVIALIICPDPDRHPAVVKYCLWPLLKEPILQKLEEDLREELQRWFQKAYPKLNLS